MEKKGLCPQREQALTATPTVISIDDPDAARNPQQSTAVGDVAITMAGEAKAKFAKVRSVTILGDHIKMTDSTATLRRQLMSKSGHLGGRSAKVMAMTAQLQATRRARSINDSIEAKYYKRSHRHWTSWKGMLWVYLTLLMFIGLTISLLLLIPVHTPGRSWWDWSDFGPRETMVTGSHFNFILIAISRLTAYMMYPCVILTFTSKAHCLRTWLWTSMLRLYLPFLEQFHEIHKRAGWLCFGLTWVHTIFHIWRWMNIETLHLLHQHQTGVTGFIGTICVTAVSLPMGIPYLRKTISYEYRKGMHTIGGVAFGLCGALHAPATKVIWVYMITVAIYVLDWICANVLKSYEVEFCHFTRLQESVVLHWENPKGYSHTQHGYVNICIPFVDQRLGNNYQWHAITIYPHTEENCSSIIIAKVGKKGSWSRELHNDMIWKTTRPVWIQGPFLTPYAAAVMYDNAICVATGSGISAALAALQSLKNHRRISLIWLCRDPSMVNFYLENYEFDDDAWTLIYYTGRQALSVGRTLPPMVMIFDSRPDLRSVVCMIIKSIESGDCLPEALTLESEVVEEEMNKMQDWLDSLENLDDPVEIFRCLLGRSLKCYKYAELLQMFEGADEAMDMGQFEVLLMKLVPEARLGMDVLEALAEKFDSKGDRSTVDRAMLVDHIKGTLAEFMTNGSRLPADYNTTEATALYEAMEAEAFEHKSTTSIGRDPTGITGCSNTQKAQNMMQKGGASQDLKNWMFNNPDLTEVQADGRLKTWGVLYCGGSNPVDRSLTKVCRDFDIHYNQEKFDW